MSNQVTIKEKQMKKMLTLIAIGGLSISLSFAQWEAGTKSVGSLFSFSSSNSGEEGDESMTTLSIEPAGSYFVIDNVSADVSFVMKSSSYGDADWSSTDIGIGASYYMNNIYGGGGLILSSQKEGDGDASKANYLQIKAGYLHSMVENWYFDIGLRYNMGMGKYKMGDTEGADNKSSLMTLGVGVVTFF